MLNGGSTRATGRGMEGVLDVMTSTDMSEAFVDAVVQGDEEGVDTCLLDGEDIDARHQNQTPLLIAAQRGNSKMVEVLLARAANPDAALENGDTALHLACYAGNKAAVEMLLQYGAKLDAIGHMRNRPLHYAVTAKPPTANHEYIIKLLIQRGANVKVKNEYGNLPLQMSHHWDKDEIKDLLKKAAVNIEEVRGQLRVQSARAAAHAHKCQVERETEERQAREKAEAEAKAAAEKLAAQKAEEERLLSEELERYKKAEEERLAAEAEALRLEEEARRLAEEEAAAKKAKKGKKKGKKGGGGKKK